MDTWSEPLHVHEAAVRRSILIQKSSVSKVAFSCRGVCRYFQTDQVRPCTYQRYYQFMHGYVLPRVVVLVDSIARAVRGMWCAGSIRKLVGMSFVYSAGSVSDLGMESVALGWYLAERDSS